MVMYPLFLDLRDRLAVVVGSGPVGLRRAVRLLNSGARLRIISLDSAEQLQIAGGQHADEIRQAIHKAGATIEWISEVYHCRHLDGAYLVFANATPAVNSQVVADSRSRGILVNSASDPSAGDFCVPAVMQRGDLQIAVGTAGAAPAVTRQIRAMLEQQFDNAWGVWLDIQRQLRQFVLETIEDGDVRKLLFERLSAIEWLERIRAQGAAIVMQEMRQVVNEARGR